MTQQHLCRSPKTDHVWEFFEINMWQHFALLLQKQQWDNTTEQQANTLFFLITDCNCTILYYCASYPGIIVNWVFHLIAYVYSAFACFLVAFSSAVISRPALLGLTFVSASCLYISICFLSCLSQSHFPCASLAFPLCVFYHLPF